jgi:dienelactone hydrolase
LRLIGSTLLLLAGPLAAQTPTVEWIPTDFVEDGQPVRLELVVYRPAGNGPYPTLIFNHGSTGSGSDTTLYRKVWTSLPLARFFTARGWLVAFPQRRGRGHSGGRYAEGLAADGSGYTCSPPLALGGLDRALEDVDAAVHYLANRPDVDPAQMLIGGQSRGGILSIVHAGTRTGRFRGAINFVGGWMSDRCPDPGAINTVAFRRGAAAAVPTLWLYGEGDPFYGISHSRSNFDAFVAAGGLGQWVLLKPPSDANGHQIIRTPALWGSAVDTLLAGLALKR